MNKKVYEDILSGRSDHNIRFGDFQNLIVALGFDLKRQRGSHTMYYNKSIQECLNIQSDGSKEKAYQVRQLRDIILKYGL